MRSAKMHAETTPLRRPMPPDRASAVRSNERTTVMQHLSALVGFAIETDTVLDG